MLLSSAQKLQRKTPQDTPAEIRNRRALRTLEFPRRLIAANRHVSGALEEQHGCTAEQFRDAVLNSALSVAVTDRNGSFVSVSPSFCALIQCSEHELLGRDYITLIHPGDRANYAAIQRGLASGVSGPIAVEIRLLTRPHRTLWVRNNISLVPDSFDRPSCFIVLIEDIGEQKKAERAIKDLSTRLLRLQDEERRRIARELHDNTSQNLSALVALLAAVKESGSLDRRSRTSLAEAIVLAKQSAREVRSVSYLLHPPLLDHFDLPDALRGYIQGLSRRSGLDIKLEIASNLGKFPKDIEATLYRLIQEGLNNVLRHSGSKRAVVKLQHKRHCLLLQIRDFGHGMTLEHQITHPDGQQLGVGILGMRERVEQFGGEFEIHSGNSGTAIRVLLPLEKVPNEECADSCC